MFQRPSMQVSQQERREALLRRTQIKPVTVSIIKWIRNDELLYEPSNQ
jgi:hypothetical protein